MSTKLAPISYASSIVGFTSFAFTFFTFVRVFWETILTLWSAPKQMMGYLDNLRIELHNERAYFKSALRRTRSRSRSVKRYHEDIGPLKILNGTVRRIHREFIRLEKPFLNISPSRAEKDLEHDSEEIVDTDYAPMTLARRWKWMRTKSHIIAIADSVNRIQTQRIACDTTNLLMKLHTMDKSIQDFEDRLWDIEEHIMGERLDDGRIYVKRRVDRSPNRSPR
ncbi:MAG: hypothetical protein ALECFALPRED_002794 [Alectoria fallacina]|uniref:Uncharacterized protein n=1 Tax=Alectoria fallacina TaxID=1903189 RepID=A0A8H3IRD4_9LECA|nr:MAG: hypothetical protein ALECFALPRED_002794 [Alectoria fallacina]